MPHDRKIATCCYCGRRTVLELTARGGHELACGSCGAPLHEMKALKPPSGSAKYAPPKPRTVTEFGQGRKKSAQKKKKKLWKKAFGEVFDLVEDILD